MNYSTLLATDIKNFIPKRSIDAHKGDSGTLLIIGGNYGMGGAVIMAAEAAYRSGAGKVVVLTRPEHVTPLLSRIPSAMIVDSSREIDWTKIFLDKTVLVIGPGLGQDDWAKQLFDLALSSDLPKVIDADALNLLSTTSKKYNLQNAIITPHPGEAARLLNCDVKTIQDDRQLAIKKLYDQYQATVILKGHNSLILSHDQKLFLCPYGNPGMAVAGMGDVLSGVVAGLLGQNVAINRAAVLATTVHGVAGDMAAKKQGQIGLLATDLISYIPEVLN